MLSSKSLHYTHPTIPRISPASSHLRCIIIHAYTLPSFRSSAVTHILSSNGACIHGIAQPPRIFAVLLYAYINKIMTLSLFPFIADVVIQSLRPTILSLIRRDAYLQSPRIQFAVLLYTYNNKIMTLTYYTYNNKIMTLTLFNLLPLIQF